MGPWTDKWQKVFAKLESDKKNYEKCYYCEEKALFNQPEKQSGEIVDVCRKHFTMDQAT